jgi:hypothetical protein
MAQSHTAKSDGGDFQVAFSKFALLHCFSFKRHLLSGLVHLLSLLVVHNFRCVRRASALAERANLLAKRAML